MQYILTQEEYDALNNRPTTAHYDDLILVLNNIDTQIEMDKAIITDKEKVGYYRTLLGSLYDADIRGLSPSVVLDTWKKRKLD